jgi:hypothetical protein
MSKVSKIEIEILSGRSDGNINFNDLRALLANYDFDERIKGIIIFSLKTVLRKS